jgi:peptidoglycan L-alanyl-D-glutamate endopeptidase CwlK
MILRKKSKGKEVKILQELLKKAGFNPGVPDGDFGSRTEIAVINFQKSHELLPDGVVGPKTLAVLNKVTNGNDLELLPDKPITSKFTVKVVQQIFFDAPKANVEKFLPFVLKALTDADLAERNMILMALATIRAETAGFIPIGEFKSKYNTSPGGHPFDLYDNRADLGNKGKPDGATFKGRGFIQLTGRSNYKQHGAAIGLGNQLIDNPELANEPTIAAKLLASFIKNKEQAIKVALLNNNLKEARRLVNGGSHGLTNFTNAFRAGEKLVPEP